MKKFAGDIIILHMFTKNHSHMKYGSWDTKYHFGPFFALLPPYRPRKSKFWKNEKNIRRYYHFTNVKWQSYDVWFLRYGVQQTEFFVILDQFLQFYPPNKTKNLNFEIIKKKHLEILSVYTCVPKIMIRWCTVPEKWCATNGRKKWHIEVGAPPKKLPSPCEEVTVGKLKCKQRGELARF